MLQNEVREAFHTWMNQSPVDTHPFSRSEVLQIINVDKFSEQFRDLLERHLFNMSHWTDVGNTFIKLLWHTEQKDILNDSAN